MTSVKEYGVQVKLGLVCVEKSKAVRLGSVAGLVV
jgi:hypothetical protein